MKVSLNGLVSVYSGDPQLSDEVYGDRATVARFGNLHTILVVDEVILVFDAGYGTIKMIKNDMVSHFAGQSQSSSYRARENRDGPKDEAGIASAWGLTLAPYGSLIFSDREKGALRMISTNGFVSTLKIPSELESSNLLHGICSAMDRRYYLADSDGVLWRFESLYETLEMKPVARLEGRQRHRFESICAGYFGDERSIFICNHYSNIIQRFNIDTEVLTDFLQVTTPRGICIPKSGVMVIAENRKDSVIIQTPHVIPYRSLCYNKSLLYGPNYDSIGFGILLSNDVSGDVIRNSIEGRYLLSPTQLIGLDSTFLPILHHFQPEDTLILPSPNSSISYHHHIIEVLGLSSSFHSALSSLHFDSKIWPLLSQIHFSPSLPDILLQFIYSCGQPLDLSFLPFFHRHVASAALLVAVKKLGFSSASVLQTFYETSKPCESDALTRQELYSWFDKHYAQSSEVHDYSKECDIPLSLKSPNKWVIDNEIRTALLHSITVTSTHVVWSHVCPDISALEAEHMWAVKVIGEEGCVLVHDWILATRWRYFRRALAAGMHESMSRTLELPSGLPPDFVAALMRFIYNPHVQSESDWSLECRDLISEHSKLLEMEDLDGVPWPGFDSLLALCSYKGS